MGEVSTIAIVGATGVIGSEIAKEATHRGLKVIGISRSGTAKEPLPGVEYRQGNLLDTPSILSAAQDADAIVIATAATARGGTAEQAAEVVAAHKALIEARPSQRIFVVGGAGGLVMPDGKRMIESMPADYLEPRIFAQVLDLYLASDESLNWTMQVPAIKIEKGAATPKYSLGGDNPVGDHVFTGTFAIAALDELEHPAHLRQRYNVADAA